MLKWLYLYSVAVAAIVETSTDPWFFKTVGPEATINHWRPAFEKFAGSMKHK